MLTVLKILGVIALVCIAGAIVISFTSNPAVKKIEEDVTVEVVEEIIKWRSYDDRGHQGPPPLLPCSEGRGDSIHLSFFRCRF